LRLSVETCITLDVAKHKKKKLERFSFRVIKVRYCYRFGLIVTCLPSYRLGESRVVFTFNSAITQNAKVN